MPRIVLASASPRRRSLLDLIGLRHEVIPADVDESLSCGELPEPHAERLALAKAAKVAVEAPDALVIGADTIVVVEEDILGKPAHEAEARAMLGRLSGRTHTVVTGIACIHQGKPASAVERVAVTFRALSADDIERYIATGEPMDKAGAYGIQGYGATIVERIEGDYFAVMGLSLVRLVALMREVGVSYDFPR